MLSPWTFQVIYASVHRLQFFELPDRYRMLDSDDEINVAVFIEIADRE